MLQGVSSKVMFSSLPFFIEGVRALEAKRVLAPRQTFSATAVAPIPSSYLVVNDFLTPLTACTITNVTWFYAGPFADLELIATNIGVPQDPPPTSLPSRPTFTFSDRDVLAVPSGASTAGKTTVLIADNVDPLASSVPWNVNVAAGWYQILASMDSTFQTQVDPFYVQLGSDTSCLSATQSSSTTAIASSPTSQVFTPPASPIPGQTAPPVSTTSKDSRVGVIVGVVAAAVVFMIIVLIAYLWLRRRKNALDKPVGGKTGGAKLSRGWGGLGSINSLSPRQDGRSRASRDITPATRNVGHHLPTGSMGASYAEDEYRSGNSTTFPPYEEKFYHSPASDKSNPFDDAQGGLALAEISSHGTKALSSSRTSLQLTGIMQPHLRSSSVDSFEPHRPPSSSYGANTPFESSPPVSYPYSSSTSPAEMDRSHSASSSRPPSTNIGHQQRPTHRESTGSQSASARKTVRKPVPVYDPSLPTTSYASNSPPPTAYVPSPITPTVSSTPFSSIPSGHYSKRSLHSNHTPETNGGLAHKSSFGPGGIDGKPVHYLIPDMPLPNKD